MYTTWLICFLSCRLVFGTLYPAYSSYKAVKSKDVKEYVSISLLCFIIPYEMECFCKSFVNVNYFPCSVSGKMDDVLDNICLIYRCRSIYGHVSMLVRGIFFE